MTMPVGCSTEVMLTSCESWDRAVSRWSRRLESWLLADPSAVAIWTFRPAICDARPLAVFVSFGSSWSTFVSSAPSWPSSVWA